MHPIHRMNAVMKNLNVWLYFLVLLAVVYGCTYATQDQVNLDVRPTTRLAINEIGRIDSLSTKVRLQWSGSVADGFVTGYRIFWSFNPVGNPEAELANQTVVTRSDSTFLFTLRGQSGGSVYFYVQALDNRGRSGNAAFLKINVKNFAPVASIQNSGLPRSQDVYSVLTIPVAVSDVDGNETIDSLYVKVNNGAWFPLDPRTSLITLVPNDPGTTSTAPGAARVFSTIETSSITTTQVPGLASGIVVGDSNTIYIRCKDLAGEFSRVDTADRKFFIRRKTSDLLVVDSWSGGGLNADQVNANLLAAVYPAGHDKIDLFEDGNKYQPVQPRLWRVSFGLLLRLYNKVYWYSDAANTITNNVADGNSTLLQTASPALQDYLQANGKLMVSCRNYIIPDGTPNTRSYPEGSLITRILSIGTIFNNDITVRMASNTTLRAAAGTGYPDMQLNNQLLTGFMPYRVNNDATLLYSGNMTLRGNAYPNTDVALRKQNAFNGRTNLVFFGIDFHLFNGNPTAQTQVLDKILNQEFNW